MIYSCDDIEIDTDQFELRRGGVVHKVEPQVFALIELLVSNHGRIVSKDELNQQIWGGRFVSDAVVNSRIRSARLALGDNGTAQRLIRTVRSRGFRFVVEPKVTHSALPALIPRQAAQAEAPKNTEDDLSNGRPSIAVLPFDMMSVGHAYPMIADAIAHETIAELARLRWLFVIARGSSFRFRGRDIDRRTAGSALGVRYLLTGSVAVDGKRCVVSVELSHAEDDQVIWADRIEATMDDLLQLPHAMATQIVAALDLRIPMAEAARTMSVPTENLDVWSSYHRGLWHMYRFNAHDNEIAGHMFDRAIAADSRFARAYAGLSYTHFQNAFMAYSQDKETERNLSRQCAERGMELDALDPFTNLIMGRSALLVRDFENSRSWFERSRNLSPNYAAAIYNSSWG